ncbi:MAG: LysR family transcriptional regulator [Actinobacteria bacterium]|nr:LysR family transcriptional regulator [Actinomycetota bacterium]
MREMHARTDLYAQRMDRGATGVDVRMLRALVAVVDEGSFTDAAIVLGVSQASVSRAVAALEEALGARLLQRTTRHVGLTVTGRRVLAHARRALDEVAALRRVAQDGGGELRVGYAWSALGRHTTAVQRRWAAEHPGSALVLVQSNTRTAGLADGIADLAVLRRPADDDRVAGVVVGLERRYAAVAASDPLARRRRVRLADFAGRTIGVDALTGTTSEELWPSGVAPAGTREVHGVDEWLTLVAAGQAVGITSEATTRQHPRPGVVYRPVEDAPPVAVTLAWWRDDPHPQLAALRRLVVEAYGTSSD